MSEHALDIDRCGCVGPSDFVATNEHSIDGQCSGLQDDGIRSRADNWCSRVTQYHEVGSASGLYDPEPPRASQQLRGMASDGGEQIVSSGKPTRPE